MWGSLKTNFFYTKYQCKNFVKRIKANKLKESKKLKQVLKDILYSNDILEIPESLKKAGFYKFNEYFNGAIISDDVINGISLACVERIDNNVIYEMEIFENVKNLEDKYVILFTSALMKDNDIKEVMLLGIFCDQSHATEKDTVENLISKLTFANAKS